MNVHEAARAMNGSIWLEMGSQGLIPVLCVLRGLWIAAVLHSILVAYHYRLVGIRLQTKQTMYMDGGPPWHRVLSRLPTHTFSMLAFAILLQSTNSFTRISSIILVLRTLDFCHQRND